MSAIAALVSEIRAAEVAGDLPRRERAAFALRTRFGVSIVDPKSQIHYSPYRATAP
jgi:hypothetical protein